MLHQAVEKSVTDMQQSNVQTKMHFMMFSIASENLYCYESDLSSMFLNVRYFIFYLHQNTLDCGNNWKMHIQNNRRTRHQVRSNQ